MNLEQISLHGESSLGSRILVFILNLEVTCSNILPSCPPPKIPNVKSALE